MQRVNAMKVSEDALRSLIFGRKSLEGSDNNCESREDDKARKVLIYSKIAHTCTTSLFETFSEIFTDPSRPRNLIYSIRFVYLRERRGIADKDTTPVQSSADYTTTEKLGIFGLSDATVGI